MTSSPTVAVIDHRFGSLDAEEEILAALGARLVKVEGTAEEQVMPVAAKADGILLGLNFTFTRERIAKLERCKVIARYGVGFDNVDVAAAEERGITVAYVPDYCIEEVATHAIAMLLAVHRRLLEFDAGARRGEIASGFSVPRLSECTLGVLGFGRIGTAVASRAAALGLRVIAHDPFLPDEAIRSAGATPVNEQDAIAESDFLTLHMPLLPSTHHILNRETLFSMRRGAVIINVARGGLIDEFALAEAIESGHLGGAGLDVNESEPLPADHPLQSVPGVILTPHVAWLSTRAFRDLQVRTAEEVARALRGEPVLNKAQSTT
jgi:D-3-phosphoglycerate dehydrogenase